MIELAMPQHYDPDQFYEKRVKGAKWGSHTPLGWSDWEDTDDEERELRTLKRHAECKVACKDCAGFWIRVYPEQYDFEIL